MIKKYTNKDYADKACEANREGKKLYIWVYEEEREIEVPEYDEEGNIIGYHTEIIKETVEELLIERPNYYICYEANYTDGTINPNYEQEEAQKERQRLDSLTLTPADVERALYKAKGMDFEDLKEVIQKAMPTIDIKALSIEFRAKDFYRGATANGMRLFDAVGQLLGYKIPDDMDYLFTHKELPKEEI